MRQRANGEVARSAVYAVNVGAAAALGVISTLWLTHIVAPSDFGFYAVVIAWGGISGVLMYGWNTSALTRLMPGSDPEKVRALRTFAWRLALATALMGGVVGALVVPWSQQAGLGLLLAACGVPLNLRIGESRALSRVGVFTLYNLAQALGTATAPIVVALTLENASGPALASATVCTIAVLSALTADWSSLVGSKHVSSDVRSSHLKFGLPLIPAAVGLMALASGDRLVVAWQLGDAAAGAYAANYALFVRPFLLIAAAVQMSSVARLAFVANSSGEGVALRLWARWMVGVVIGGVGLTGILLVAHPLLQRLIAPALRIDGLLFPVLACGAGAGYLAYVMAVQPANLAHRTRQNALNVVVWALAALVAAYAFLSLGEGLTAVVGVSTVAYWGAALVIGFYGVRRIIASGSGSSDLRSASN